MRKPTTARRHTAIGGGFVHALIQCSVFIIE
jgi:hypothetical protein